MKAPRKVTATALTRYQLPLCLLALTAAWQSIESAQTWLHHQSAVAQRPGAIKSNTTASGIPVALPQIALAASEIPQLQGIDSDDDLHSAFSPPASPKPTSASTLQVVMTSKPRQQPHPLKQGYYPVHVTGMTDRGAFINGVYTPTGSPISNISYTFKGQQLQPTLKAIHISNKAVIISDKSGFSTTIKMESAR